MNICKNRFLNNASWMIGGKIFQMVIFLFIGMMIARYLGPSNYGILSYSASLVAFFTSLCTLGLNGIIIKVFVSDQENQGIAIGTAITMRLTSSLISMITILILISILKPNDNVLLLISFWQSLSLMFQSFNIINFWYQSKLKSKKATIIQSIAYIIAAIFKIIILLLHKNIQWFAFSTTLDISIIAVLLLIAYFKDGGQKLQLSFSLAKGMLSESYHFIISGLMVAIYAQTDKIMIGNMLDSTSVGLYSVAITICGLWAFIPSSIIDSARPIIMELKDTNYYEYIRRLKQLYATIIWLSIIYGIFISCFSKIILLILYGKAYFGAQDALIIAVWYCSFSYLGSAKNIWLICEGKQRYEKWFTLFGALINIFLNLTLIPLFGINGAAIATLCTQILTNFIVPYFIKDTRVSSKYMLDAFLLKGIISKSTILKIIQILKKVKSN